MCMGGMLEQRWVPLRRLTAGDYCPISSLQSLPPRCFQSLILERVILYRQDGDFRGLSLEASRGFMSIEDVLRLS